MDIKYGANIVAKESIETEQWPSRCQNSYMRILVSWRFAQKNQLFISLLNQLRTISENARSMALTYKIDTLQDSKFGLQYDLSRLTSFRIVIRLKRFTNLSVILDSVRNRRCIQWEGNPGSNPDPSGADWVTGLWYGLQPYDF